MGTFCLEWSQYDHTIHIDEDIVGEAKSNICQSPSYNRRRLGRQAAPSQDGMVAVQFHMWSLSFDLILPDIKTPPEPHTPDDQLVDAIFLEVGDIG